MNPNPGSSSVTRQFRGDSTARWSCRKGEYVLWVATDSFLTSNNASSWSIHDFWEMRDGDYLTITNRWADLPGWFELHPLEVANQAVWEMEKRLAAGYKPGEVMDGPSLWRVKTGDRLIWVTTASLTNPVKEMLDLRACALVLGENASPSVKGNTAFGAPDSDDPTPAASNAMRAGFNAAVNLGVPREFAPQWSFGA